MHKIPRCTEMDCPCHPEIIYIKHAYIHTSTYKNKICLTNRSSLNIISWCLLEKRKNFHFTLIMFGIYIAVIYESWLQLQGNSGQAEVGRLLYSCLPAVWNCSYTPAYRQQQAAGKQLLGDSHGLAGSANPDWIFVIASRGKMASFRIGTTPFLPEIESAGGSSGQEIPRTPDDAADQEAGRYLRIRLIRGDSRSAAL
jgi:hypothetical protein